MTQTISTAFNEVAAELDRARVHGGFNSLHEAWAVILEEVDELWDHVKLKKRARDPRLIRKELIQIAAMAIKAIAVLDETPERFVGGTV